MSFKDEGDYVLWTLDPKIFAFMTAFVRHDVEAMQCFGDEPFNFMELVISVLTMWQFAIEAGEELGGPSMDEVLRGIGLGLAKLEEEEQ